MGIYDNPGVPILSIITYVPLVGAVLIAFFVNKANTRAIKAMATAVAAIDFILSIPLWLYFDAHGTGAKLFQFREGNRKNPQMSPMAANLSNADMNNLADYYAGLKAAPPKHRTAPANASAGPELAKKFNCTQCHGPALLGQQQMPRLAGQQPEYLRAQLKGFKAGTRADMDGNMTSAARELNDKDIEVLVDYIAGLGAQ